jgi:hypothetical protein
MDANSPNILVAGSNDLADEQACPQPLAFGGRCVLPGTGVGISGVYFSFDSGHSWVQPAYTGWTTADCDPATLCKGHVGAIHTLPGYFENGLVTAGDPAVAVGPIPGRSEKFSWANGERVYYGSLASALSTQVDSSFSNPVFNGFLGLAVSRLDNPTPTSVMSKSSWMAPVIVSSHQGQASFQDKDQIWADNASSSPFFGRVYLCSNDFRSNAAHLNGNFPTPMLVFTSKDGGDTWSKVQVTSASTNDQAGTANGSGYSGCTLRTDSSGVVYLFAERFSSQPLPGAHVMFTSSDGGAHWSKGQVVQNVTNLCYFVDPLQASCVIDGYAGARTDVSASPSISIANGAPSGRGATNEIVDAWPDAPVLNGERTNASFSTDGGSTWSAPQAVSLPGDRPLYAAPAIAPDGSRVYVVYEADTAPWGGADFTSRRPYHGVLRTSTLNASGAPTGWTTEFNEAPGDLRATHPGYDFVGERVGDYVYAAASTSYGVGVWASAIDARVCDDVQNFREALFTGLPIAQAPWPLSDCPPTFGNLDIRSISTG